MIEGVFLYKLARVAVSGGDVLHAIKSNESGYVGFGEAYFSIVNRGAIKGWKRHQRMTLNLIVPMGAVRFVIHDDRPLSATCGLFQQHVISQDNYCRLTVPPMVWMGFQGVGNAESLVLNVANIAHDPNEADRLSLTDIKFDWSER